MEGEPEGVQTAYVALWNVECGYCRCVVECCGVVKSVESEEVGMYRGKEKGREQKKK